MLKPAVFAGRGDHCNQQKAPTKFLNLGVDMFFMKIKNSIDIDL